MRTIRTFVAVEVSQAVVGRASSLIEQLRVAGSDVKWVEPRNMHLTLQFLGDVAEENIAAVCRAVTDAAQTQAPFEVSVAGAGAFPDARRPRTLWLGVAQGLAPLKQLAKAIEKALEKLGFRGEERGFHPHLTIGRVRQGGAAGRELGQRLQEQANFAAGSATIDHVTVFSSVLSPSGPTYEPLARVPLAGPPP